MKSSAFTMICMRISVAMSALVLGVACGGAGVGPDGSQSGGGGATAGVRIVSGGTATDTISALLRDPLTVEVIDASGKPVVGRDVHFEVSFLRPNGPASLLLTALIATGSSGPFDSYLDIPTDAKGRATVYVRLGPVAGAASVTATVPTLGDAFTTASNYTVRAGAPDHVVLAPADTVVYVGAGYRLSGDVTDRGGNKLASTPITFAVASGGATVTSDGTVTATALGRVRVTAQAAGVAGAAWLSVPPRAVVATQQHDASFAPLGIFLMGLDGSAKVPLAPLIGDGGAIDWSPDGADLVIERGDSIDLVSPGSAERLLVKLNPRAVLGARFSRDGVWIHMSMSTTSLSRIRRDGTGLETLAAGPNGIGWHPSPSPDGLSVAYGSDNSPCGVQSCIRVLDIATGQPRTYPGGKDWLVRGHESAWSPVDDLIAYAWDFDVNSNEVGLIRADGTGQRVLANDIWDVRWLEFSPDGKWLIVASRSAPVTLFNVQTGERLPLVTLLHYGATAWRP